MRRYNSHKFAFIALVSVFLFVLSSCSKDGNTPEGDELDITLAEKLRGNSANKVFMKHTLHAPNLEFYISS